MREDMTGVVWRLSIFVVVCLVGAFALLAIFAQLRFQRENTYRAQFTNVSGLAGGNFVRIAGVEVGKVKAISVRRNALVDVEFSADTSVVLTQGTRAVIRYDNLIGGRYLALEQGAGGANVLRPGDTIPVADTAPALDLDSLIGGFRPLFRALNPDQVNSLTGQLIAAFQGQGSTITSFLASTASVTNTLANRDELIEQVIANLDTVLGSLAGQSDQFGNAVTSLSELIEQLAARKSDISAGLAYTNESAHTIADLLAQARPSFKESVAQADRTSNFILADHDYFDTLLNTLPDKYRVLARQGLYGDYFSFYLCEVTLKFNGKGGQPVYVKVAGQATGRCAPK